VIRQAMRLRHRGVTTRDEQLVGAEGTVVRTLDPTGVVQVAAEEWTARSLHGRPRRGDRVRVVKMEGLTLEVEPVEAPATASAETERREP
jgi:membrane-bound ClpP family serine protease